MLLADKSINDYSALLASGAPAPGGGSAAALIGAIGVSLTCMVGALTGGREKFAEHEEFIAGLMEQARNIQSELIKQVDEDTIVFNRMSAAYKIPKDTEGDKTARKNAIQTALKDCTVTPYRVLTLSVKALDLTELAIGRSNPNVVSDLGVAALCLKAAAQSAWLNMLINLDSIKDADFAREYREKGAAALGEAIQAADSIYASVEKTCGG